jgi:uncharacterized membrane protein YgcG
VRVGSPRAALLPLLLLFALASPALGSERIERFDADVWLERDGSFTVEERISWDFGSARRHGIYRKIPVAYGRGRAADYRIRIEVEGVSDETGTARPYQAMIEDGELVVRIGDPARRVTGRQEYRLRYRVRRGILFFEGHDELYWNVTGDRWKVPMERVAARVLLPTGVAEELRGACFTGPPGAVETSCFAETTPGGLAVQATRTLHAGEGLTLVLGIPKGVIEEPTAWEVFLDRVSDYLSAWLLLPLAALLGMGALWRSQGQDPEGSAAIATRYEPPAGLTPAEVGTVLDERVDLLDVTSTILDLAVRGHLRIEELETTTLLFLKSQDYRLVRLAGEGELREHERKLCDALFSGGSDVLVSSLKNSFYQELPAIRAAIYQALVREDGYFPASPEKIRTIWRVVGIVLVVLGGVAFAAQSLGAALAFGASGLVVLVFGRAMPRRTRRGRRAYEEILGFREFVERVERDRLEREGLRIPETFERLLPYAIVLGVADVWAEAFADLYSQPPSWYGAAPGHGPFRAGSFVTDVGRSLDTMGQTLASRPSSSGSGSSGFSGGSSGGGFGGGGGGSW